MGVNRGELRVQGCNCNSMTKTYKTWVQFINKLKTQMKIAISLLIADLKRTGEGV